MGWLMLVAFCGVAAWSWSGQHSADLTFEQCLLVIDHGDDEARAVAIERLRRMLVDARLRLQGLTREDTKPGRAARRALDALK